MPQMLASLEMLEMRKINTATMMSGTNDVSRGEENDETAREGELYSRESENLLGPTLLTVCTVPYNTMQQENAMTMNERCAISTK